MSGLHRVEVIHTIMDSEEKRGTSPKFYNGNSNLPQTQFSEILIKNNT